MTAEMLALHLKDNVFDPLTDDGNVVVLLVMPAVANANGTVFVTDNAGLIACAADDKLNQTFARAAAYRMAAIITARAAAEAEAEAEAEALRKARS